MSSMIKRTLLLLTSVLLFAQPIRTFHISYSPHTELSWPFSLDDCQNRSANRRHDERQQQETYRRCLKAVILFNKARDLPSDQSAASGVHEGVVMTTKPHFGNKAKHFLPAMLSWKGFNGELLAANRDTIYNNEEGVDDDVLSHHPANYVVSSDNNEDGEDDGDGGRHGLWKEGSVHDPPPVSSPHLPPPQKKWSLPLFHYRHIERSRRQHSLSINSALVSLADMLVARDYGRQKARQRNFRQQLLGLGR